MLLACNPPKEGIKRIIDASQYKAAKWLRNEKTGETWYWPAEESTHADFAEFAGIDDYTKGIAVTE